MPAGASRPWEGKHTDVGLRALRSESFSEGPRSPTHCLGVLEVTSFGLSNEKVMVHLTSQGYCDNEIILSKMLSLGLAHRVGVINIFCY